MILWYWCFSFSSTNCDELPQPKIQLFILVMDMMIPNDTEWPSVQKRQQKSPPLLGLHDHTCETKILGKTVPFFCLGVNQIHYGDCVQHPLGPPAPIYSDLIVLFLIDSTLFCSTMYTWSSLEVKDHGSMWYTSQPTFRKIRSYMYFSA